MRKRSFIALKREIAELGLGTWALSGNGYGPIADAEADAVIDCALQSGVELFETAFVYSHGAMVARLGKHFRACPKAVAVIRIGAQQDDRVGFQKNFEPDYLRQVIDICGDALQRSQIDVVLLHHPASWTISSGQATELLQQMQNQGTIGAWGVSAGRSDVALCALEAGATVLSVPYNLLHSHSIGDIAAQLAFRPVSVLAYSVLAYGLLTDTWGAQRTFNDGDHRAQRWTPATLQRRIEQLAEIRKFFGQQVPNMRAAAIRFVLSNSLVTNVVMGPRTTAQLQQLMLDAGDGPPYLPDQLLAALPNHLASVGVIP